MKIIRRGKGEPQEIAQEHVPVLSLRDAMNKMFEESFWDPFDMFDRMSAAGARQLAGRGLYPKVDIAEDEKEIKVTADVPGMDPEQIEIEVEEDALTLSGKMEKEVKDEDKEKKYYRYEREYGEFRREFTLPAKVKTDAVTAKVKNGVLEIVLPKAEMEKKAKVQVKAG